MSWLSRLWGKDDEGQPVPPGPAAPAAPVVPDTPPLPAWAPAQATELQAERQAMLTLLTQEGDDSGESRALYADWLERNGWTEDASRLRTELEQEKLWQEYYKKSAELNELRAKPWRVQVGGEMLDIPVNSWDKGLPTGVTLTWEQLDRFGEELLKMAPIASVYLSDRPQYTVEDGDSKNSSGDGSFTNKKVTVASCRGLLTGQFYSVDGAIGEALNKRFGIKVYLGVHYGGYSFASGSISTYHLSSGAVSSGLISHTSRTG